jgi:hypothetical protein
MWQRGEMDVRRVTAKILVVSLLALVACAGLSAAAPAAASSPVQDAVVGAVAAAAADGITQSVSVVDRVTGTRVAGSGGAQQYISESIVKLFTVAYYEVQAGGRPDESMASRLRTMIIHSDDAIESSLWNVDIVPAMAARYGLANTSNGPKTGPHDWGWELITADDEADFLFKMSNDPEVAPLLMDAMANVAPAGSDGFDQSFGLNSLTGDHGSKQGWTDVGSTQRVQIHSVGWTDRFFVAILQTSAASDYETMRADSTRTAQAVLAAEQAGPTGTAADDPTGAGTATTPDTGAPEAAPPVDSASPATSEPVPSSAAPGPTTAAVPPTPTPAAQFIAALRAVGRDIGAAVTALFRPLAGD